MLYAGIDAGSRTIKVVLIDESDMRIVGKGIIDQGVRQADLAKELFDRVLIDAGVKKSDVGKITATGYGRNALDWADATVTEITCQAYAIRNQVPGVRTVIDIGGQDSKLIYLDSNGAVRDFIMNDRCAAGTGRFLEIVADRLEMQLSQIDSISAKVDKPAFISSMCVVFAETEIIGLLASEESAQNIVAGVQDSIAKRVASMSGNRIEGPVIFTGGVALVPGMGNALSKALGCTVKIADDPQITAAFGAALISAGYTAKERKQQEEVLL